jgi:histidinol-phosphate aminotransferase
MPPRYSGRHIPGGLNVNPTWAYVPPVRPDFKLNLDREETTCLPAISPAEAERLRQCDFPIQASNRYPSKLVEQKLTQSIAEDVDLRPDEVLLGNGIMSILTYVYDVFSRPGDDVTVPTPGFWPAYTYAMQRGRGLQMPLFHPFRTSSLRPQFTFPFAEIERSLAQGSPICYLCNPNNPTGTLIPFSQIRMLVQGFPKTLFILDEAYGPFAAHALDSTQFELTEGLNLVRSGFKNVLVARTFSKAYALANYRIGYVMSCHENIASLRAHMGPYDMSEMSLAMALYNYLNPEYSRNAIAKVVSNKQIYEQLLESRGISQYGGFRNSILVENLALAAKYERHGIAVRSMLYQDGIPNLVGETFRITIPADDENFAFLIKTTEAIL